MNATPIMLTLPTPIGDWSVEPHNIQGAEAISGGSSLVWDASGSFRRVSLSAMGVADRIRESLEEPTTVTGMTVAEAVDWANSIKEQLGIEEQPTTEAKDPLRWVEVGRAHRQNIKVTTNIKGWLRLVHDNPGLFARELQALDRRNRHANSVMSTLYAAGLLERASEPTGGKWAYRYRLSALGFKSLGVRR